MEGKATLDRTVWQHGGTAYGYYRNTQGRAGIACPWRMVDYWTMLRAPNRDDLIMHTSSPTGSDSTEGG